MYSNPDDKLILKTVVLAGKLLMQSGSDTARVESTMNHILCASLKNTPVEFDIFVLLNSIFVRIGADQTSFLQVKSRSNNLLSIDMVNQISRDLEEESLSLEEAYKKLRDLEQQKNDSFTVVKLLSAAFLGAGVVFLFDGTWADMIPVMAGGFFAYILFSFFNQIIDVPFASEFMATFFGGLIGYVLCTLFNTSWELVTIGTVMPLVPGIALTNSVRDIMARHYITGLIRFMECICIGAALGGGITMIYLLLAR